MMILNMIKLVSWIIFGNIIFKVEQLDNYKFGYYEIGYVFRLILFHFLTKNFLRAFLI